MPEVYVAGEVKPEEVKKAETTSTPETKVEKTETSASSLGVVDDMVNRVLKRVGETKRMACFGAYYICPARRFVDEMEDEKIVMVLRAHPITNFGWITLTLLMLMVPVVVTRLGVLSFASTYYVFMGKMLWYLITMGFAFEKFLDWYYSFLIVTNERLVDVDFINLLTRDVQYANLNHIEEPSLYAGGFIRSIFNYGDVKVATAAEEPAIEALAVPYPDKVINIISELSEELEKSRLAIR